MEKTEFNKITNALLMCARDKNAFPECNKNCHFYGMKDCRDELLFRTRALLMLISLKHPEIIKSLNFQ